MEASLGSDCGLISALTLTLLRSPLMHPVHSSGSIDNGGFGRHVATAIRWEAERHGWRRGFAQSLRRPREPQPGVRVPAAELLRGGAVEVQPIAAVVEPVRARAGQLRLVRVRVRVRARVRRSGSGSGSASG